MAILNNTLESLSNTLTALSKFCDVPALLRELHPEIEGTLVEWALFSPTGQALQLRCKLYRAEGLDEIDTSFAYSEQAQRLVPLFTTIERTASLTAYKVPKMK